MARLVYEITGDITGLQSAINQASNLIRDASSRSSELKINIPDITPQIQAGVSALDQLGNKLNVIQGNAALFGDSIKLQTQEVNAYQGAINALLANGFDPMDGDVQRLKEHVDALTNSLKNVRSVQPPGSFENVTSSLPSAENVFNPNLTGTVNQQSELIAALNQQLAEGTITTQQYNEALLAANSTLNLLGESATNATGALESEVGIIAGLKQALADLNTTRLNTLVEGDLPKLNSEIQQTEFEIQRLSNIGKEGFDSFGNSIKGVSVQNINGQLISLSNNLFGARQISRDLVRTFDSTSVGTFARSIGLLAVDFLFFAQNAQFAQASTVGATAAIATEGGVAAGSALSTSALGAAFASLITPTSLIVLGIAAAGAAFIAFEKSQKTATQTATEHIKALREEKQALDDYVTTLNPEQQVQAHAADNYAEATIKLNELVFAVKNNTGAMFDGRTALEDLQRLYPAFFGNLDEAASKTDKFTAATEGAKNALKALGEFTAANKLAQQSIEVADSNQVAANSLIPSLEKERTKLVELQKQAEKTLDSRKMLAAQSGTSILDPDILQQQSKIKDITDQIDKYNFTIAEARQKTQAFYDIANKNAPEAGLVSIKPDKISQITDQFETLKQKLDEINQRNTTLAGNTGITGYASEIAGIVKQFTDLNNAVANFKIQVDKAFDKGALSAGERNTLLSGLPSQSGINKSEDAAINQAKIKDAEATADAIQKINDQFGIKQQAGFNEELSRVKKLYDSIIEEAQKTALTQEQVEQNKQNAIAAANGNPKLLADIEKNYQAQIQQAKDAQAKIAAAQKDLLPAIQAVDEKYIQQETETYGKITDIANKAFEALDSGEASRTDKINLEWQKRATAANVYFDKLRDLAKAANLPQSSTDNINSIQAQVNVLLKAANANQISIEVSKPFANALQSATDNFITGFYSSLVNLGQERQTIDDKYISQLSAATSQSAIDQINSLKKIEQQATTSFGAVFSSLVSKFSATFNTSILSSFSKLLTENLGKALIAPTEKQLSISPEERAAQNVSTTLKSAGDSLAAEIKAAGNDFANSVRLSKGLLSGASGGSAVSDAAGFALSQVPGAGVVAGANFNASVTNAGNTLSAGLVAAGATAAGSIVAGANVAATETKAAAGQLSAKIGGLAAAASLVGGLISGVTSPTSSVGQGVGGALQGAGEGALIGSALAPFTGGASILIGAIGGAIIGGIGGLLGASKAKKQEELQQKQLEQQQQTNVLLARQNALAYTTSIIGRMSNQGVITGVDLNAFGQLTAVVSGKTIQFVLDRNSNGR